MANELGLSKEKIIDISKTKGEPKWMTDFRLKAYETFKEMPNPNFGPELKIDFDSINYYKKAELPPKRRTKAYKHCYTAIIITNTR